MKHIKKYKRNKFYQLLSIIVLFTILYFLEKEIFSYGLLVIYILQLVFSEELLHEVEIKEEQYVFKTYSLFYKNKKLIIPRNEFISIDFISENMFKNDSITILFKGEYAVVERNFYINSSPWDELNHSLIFLKKSESNITESTEPITDTQ